MENWDEVRTAYQVARLGTVSGAAEVLGVHHATVIRHIDALEGRLGVKLFQRHARGYTATDDLWQWRKNIEDGKIDRRSGSIIILDQDGETEVARYNFYEAWPCKWFVPDMDSEQSAMAIEKIELAVEKVERA